jgi:hypothetical protein
MITGNAARSEGQDGRACRRRFALPELLAQWIRDLVEAAKSDTYNLIGRPRPPVNTMIGLWTGKSLHAAQGNSTGPSVQFLALCPRRSFIEVAPSDKIMMERVMYSNHNICRNTSLTVGRAMATILIVGFPVTVHAQQAVRLSWQEFAQEGKRVDSFRKAVAMMKARNSADHGSAAYRKSWQYWANIHGYFGSQSPFGTVASARSRVPATYRQYFNGLSDATPPDQLAKDVWANCQHGTRWFFPWHRLYLFYFEKQLQDAAGDPTLRLPYWDYTNPNQLKMPDEFAQPTYIDANGVRQPNPLFEKRRAPGWDRGAALDSDSTNVDSALRDRNFPTYQSDIESNVHGYVHCTVSVDCPVVDMGSVPYSSNDPIFWIHHANIDRLWSCWSNASDHRNPNDNAFLNRSFSFVDINGQKVTKIVGDLFNGALIDYRYEKETNCSRSTLVASGSASGEESLAATKIAEMTKEKFNELLAEPKSLNVPTMPVSLKSATTKVKVKLRDDNDMKMLNSLARQASPVLPTKTRLILSGITFDAPPTTKFYVYLEDGTNPQRREYAGTINFFATEPRASSHDHEGETVAPQSGLTRAFDVTEALRKLHDDKGALTDVTVTFVATSGRHNGDETAKVNPKANLTVKSIDFQISAAK